MKRPTRLALYTESIFHFCPFKLRSVSLARCYQDANDVQAGDCYACPHVPTLKEQHGLRTFTRRLTLNRCARCMEPASEHERVPPFIGRRVPCAGFDSTERDVPLHVPLNHECTEWMVVMSASGARMTLADYREQRLRQRDPGMVKLIGDSLTSIARLRLPFVGAPQTRDAMAAAERAEKVRGRYYKDDVAAEAEDAGADNQTPVRKKRAGARRKGSKR